VLLLNSVLTVEEGKRKSHARNGWEAFTDEVIYAVNEQAPHAVFMLWGREAQKKAKFVDTSRHLILSSSHPAFLSARTGTTPFLGSKPFSKADTFLRDHGLDEIKWSLRGISN
jgi:uracil-DNA glycosylase